MILSILIAASKKNKKKLDQLLAILLPQVKEMDNLEIYIEDGNNRCSLAAKYNSLIKDAIGKYVWILNDTDIISETAVQDILTATEQEPDIMGIQGANNTSDHVTDWTAGVKSVSIHCPMKLEVAKKVKFKANSENWQDRMNNLELKETRIDKPIIQKRLGLTVVK